MKHPDFSVKNAIGMIESLQQGHLPTYNPYLTSYGARALMMCKPQNVMHADELKTPRMDTTMQINLREDRMFTYAPLPQTKNMHLMNRHYDERGALRQAAPTKSTLQLDEYFNTVDKDWPILTNLRNAITPPIETTDLAAESIQYGPKIHGCREHQRYSSRHATVGMVTNQCIEIEGVQIPFDVQVGKRINKTMDEIIQACSSLPETCTYDATKIARLFIDSQRNSSIPSTCET